MRRWWKRSTLNGHLLALQTAVKETNDPERIIYFCRRILASASDEDEALLPQLTRAMVLEAYGNALVASAEERSGPQAIALLEEALEIQNRLFGLIGEEENAPAFTNILMQRSVTLRHLGDRRTDVDRADMYELARDSVDDALSRIDRYGHPELFAALKLNQGNLLVAQAQGRPSIEASGLYTEAIECYTDSLVARSGEDKLGRARTHMNRCNALLMLAQISEHVEALVWSQEAAESVDSAIALLQGDQRSDQWGQAHALLGTVLTRQAQIKKSGEEQRMTLLQALESYDRALEAFRSQGNTLRCVTVLNGKGIAFTHLGLTYRGNQKIDYLKQAVLFLDQAILLLDSLSDAYEYASMHNNKASALEAIVTAVGRSDDTEQMLRQALFCRELALTYYGVEEMPLARRQTACLIAEARLTLALVHSDSDDSPDTNELEFGWEAARKGIEAAQTLARQSPTLLFRESDWAEEARLYRVATTIRALQGHLDETVTLAEAGRSRAFSILRGRRTLQLDRLRQDDQEVLSALWRMLMEAEAATRVGEQRIDSIALQKAAIISETTASILQRLRMDYPDLLDERSWHAEDIVAELEPGEALIYLLPSSQGTLALAIPKATPPRAKWIPSLTSRSLLDLILRHPDEDLWEGYLSIALSLGKGSLDKELDTLLPLLGDLLMRDVVQLAQQLHLERAIVVPGGMLAVLPLHAASYLQPAEGQGSIARRVYACDELRMVYAPSGSMYVQAHAEAKKRDRPKSGFVVGNPKLTGPTEQWTPRSRGYLGRAEREAQIVAGYMQEAGLQVTQLTGASATAAAVEAGLRSADVAHLAMHSVFDVVMPVESALLAASGEKVMMYPWLDEQESALARIRLLVLSSCQSALRDVRSFAEEPAGLFGMLLMAGAGGVVGSLWPVYDHSCATLMASFHHHYLREGEPPDIALYSAMQELRELGNSSSPGSQSRSLRLLADTSEVVRADESATGAWVPLDHPVHWAPFVYYGS